MRAIRWIPSTTLLGLTLLAAACGGSDHHPAGPGGGLTGTWTLVGINEDGIPESEDYNCCRCLKRTSDRSPTTASTGTRTLRARLPSNDH